MTRTFIALEMNEDLQSHLIGVIRQVAHLLPRLHWVDPLGIHLTLAFLGELDVTRLEQARQATAIAAQQVMPFSYNLSRIGIFGPPNQPRVVWMGIEEQSATLSQLHRILNQELVQRGFTVDSRPFSPHLTLARVKNSLTLTELQDLQDIIGGKQDTFISLNTYPANSVCVMKSELLKTEALYTLMDSYPLSSI